MNCATPHSLEELAAALAGATEKSVILAGGTDWLIKHRAQQTAPDQLIYLGKIPGIDAVRADGGHVRIGAMAPMVRIAEALEHTKAFYALAEAAGNVGSPQIRSKATFAGNLCSASPAGDLLPVALLYDAAVEVMDQSGNRARIPTADFIIGAKKTVLTHRQAVIAIHIDLPAPEDCVSAFEKVGSRKDVTISREGLAGLLRRAADGTISEARFALGAVSGVPLRLPEAEALAVGCRPEALPLEALAELVSAAVGAHCRAGSRQYKSAAARGLTCDVLEKLAKRLASFD